MRAALVRRLVTYAVTGRYGARVGRVTVVVDAMTVDAAHRAAACLQAIEASSTTPDDVVLLVASIRDAPAIDRVRLVEVSQGDAFAAAMEVSTSDAIALIDAGMVPSAAWLAALGEMVVSPATALVLGRIVDAPAEDVATRWRAAHRSYDLGDMPMVNPRVVHGGNVLVRRNLVGKVLRDVRNDVDPVASLARRALGLGLIVRHAPDAVATRVASPGLGHEIRRWCHEVREGADVAEMWARGLEAMRADLAVGASDLAYASVLACLTVARGAGLGADALSGALSRPGALSVGEASLFVRDLDALGSGDASAVRPVPDAALAFARWVDAVPWGAWRRLVAGRGAVAAVEGWAPSPATTPRAAPETWWPEPWCRASRGFPPFVDDLVALVATGRPGTPAAEAMFLAVTRTAPTRVYVERWSQLLDRVTGVRCRLDAVASDAIGWLPASSRTVMLFHDATCIWGDEAVVRAIPAWQSSETSAIEAFGHIAHAERALDTGDAETARMLAMRAYAVGHGRFVGGASDQRSQEPSGSLPRAGVPMRDLPASAVTAIARAIIEDQLFTWEDDGPGSTPIARWLQLRSRARATSESAQASMGLQRRQATNGYDDFDEVGRWEIQGE